MKKKDKIAIIDEVWTDEYIESFVHWNPYNQNQINFDKLVHAYRSMRPKDFKKFYDSYLTLYDSNPTNTNKVSFLDYIKQHKKSSDYQSIIMNGMVNN